MSNDSAVESLTCLDLWEGEGTRLQLLLSADEPVMLVGGESSGPAVQPLVEILAVGQGHSRANLRHTATGVGTRLRLVSHSVDRDGPWRVVVVEQIDEDTGLQACSTLRVRVGGRSLESRTTVTNVGDHTVHLQAVSSLMIGSPLGATRLVDARTIEGHSDWVGENRWTTTPLRNQDGLVDLDLAAHQSQDARGARTVLSHGTWSSGERVPAGVLAAGDDRDAGPALAWQVDHNGAWRVELAERWVGEGLDHLVLGMFGPTDVDHSWVRSLLPGESFESVPVSVAASDAGWAGAVAEMTHHRRALRRRRPAQPLVVFNDYMNTIMGDPTTAKLLPLISAAASVGADYFCIDAGWYDDAGDWWSSVGLWEASVTRFPDGGLERVVGHIRSAGMIPGLWLEPEVVGVRSPLAASLPPEAFLQRNGVRVLEHDRYLLDLRSPQAVAHLDSVVDRLVTDLQVGYLKLDYNVTPGVGTDLDADSVGDGLLKHNRAHLAWIDALQRRHPHLVIENCASGSMRADYALLARLDLQSTSDQQNALLYPPIAVGSLVSILPEQAASWAYPQPEMSREEIVFTMVTGLSGRLYLSGRVDAMDREQLELVREGVDLAHRWSEDLFTAVPAWPLGLPQWGDSWVASGLSASTETLVAVWWRGTGSREVVIDLPPGAVEIAYPSTPDPGDNSWEIQPDGGGRTRLRVATDEPSARVLRIRHEHAS